MNITIQDSTILKTSLQPAFNVKVIDNIRNELTQGWKNALDGKVAEAVHNYKTCSKFFECLPGELHEHKVRHLAFQL